MNKNQEHYLNTWHDSFVNFISASQAEVVALLDNPLISEQDRHYLVKYQEKLMGQDVRDVEDNLRKGKVYTSTISKIERLQDDLIDIAWDHLLDSPIVRKSLKEFSHLRLQFFKNLTIKTISDLQIPIQEG